MLDGNLRIYSIQVGKADLLKIQGEKEALLAQIGKIKEAIAAETANEKPYLVEPDHPLSLLMQQRNAFLADIAIGELVDQAELDAVQEKISEQEARLSEAIDSSIVQANTTEGLKRKLSDCEEQLKIVEQQHKDAFFHFLSIEIEAAGRKYSAMALEFGDLFTWITAASDLLKKCGTPKPVLDIGSSDFRIPTLRLAGCTAPGVGYVAKHLFRYERVNRNAAVLDVINWLDKMGIEPPVAGN
jgi:hypothetical protein